MTGSHEQSLAKTLHGNQPRDPYDRYPLAAEISSDSHFLGAESNVS